MSKKLTDKDIDDLTSYADGEGRIRARLKVSGPQLKELALNANVEKCPGCGWWCESHELIPVDSDEPDGKCSNCRISES